MWSEKEGVTEFIEIKNIPSEKYIETKQILFSMTLRRGYEPPADIMEVDVVNPETHGIASKRYTDYEVRLKV